MALIATDSKHYSDIADAIRTQNGTTTTYKPSEMAPAILAIVGPSGDLPEITTEDLTFTGDLSSFNAGDKATPLFNKYADYISFNGTTSMEKMHQNAVNLEKASAAGFSANQFDGCTNLKSAVIRDYNNENTVDINEYMFRNCVNLETIRPYFTYNATYTSKNGNTPTNINYCRGMFQNCHKLTSLSVNNSSGYWYVRRLEISTSGKAFITDYCFQNCYALKTIPDSLLAYLFTGSYNNNILKRHTYNKTSYRATFDGCLSLRELKVYGIIDANRKTIIGHESHYQNAFDRMAMLSKIRFCHSTITNGGWISYDSNFVIDLSTVGYSSNDADSAILTGLYGSPVTTAAEYETKKDTADWWTNDPAFSRFNLSSAVDCLTYLYRLYQSSTDLSQRASATIKFKADAGSGTDGGGISSGALPTSLLATCSNHGWTVALV